MRVRAPAASIATATWAERFAVFTRVAVPVWAKGILLRRPRIAALEARWRLDAGAMHLVQRLRRRYDGAALLLRKTGPPQLLLLSPADLKRVLDRTPEPFSPATQAKRAAIAHYEPHVSLISRGAERIVRRKFNDDILDSGCIFHRLALRFAEVVREEAMKLLGTLRSGEEMTWPIFTAAWYAAVRRIVLGDHAGADQDLTDQLARLRAGANWVFLRPATTLREHYFGRLAYHLHRAEPGTLAELIARRRKAEDERPLDQVTHWLFACDAGGMTTFRALALFAAHPQQQRKAAAELDVWRAGGFDLPYLRAAFLDAVRLWPTTPVILRQSTERTTWGTRNLAWNAGLIIYVPFFHRDDERLTTAHRFDPEQWLGKDPADNIPFVPFSAGPAACPGRHLVTLVGSFWLAALLGAGRYDLIEPQSLRPGRPLPLSLYPFSIRLRFSR